MLVDAIYENGHLLFNQPLHFAHTRFLLKVDLPDIEIIGAGPSALPNVDCTYSGEAAEFRAMTDVLFDKAYQYLPEISDQEILSEELSKKYA